MKFYIDGEPVSAEEYHQAIYDGKLHNFFIVSDGKPESIEIIADTNAAPFN